MLTEFGSFGRTSPTAPTVGNVEQFFNVESFEMPSFSLALLSLVVAVGDHRTAQHGGEGRGQKVAHINGRGHFYTDVTVFLRGFSRMRMSNA